MGLVGAPSWLVPVQTLGNWTFNAQTSSAQVVPGAFAPFISPGWQWHPQSLIFFLGWADSRGQPLVTIFDPRAYHLHTLYFVEFVPEETPRLENQYILMPPSSGIPSFHVPYQTAPQLQGQPRFRDLLPVAIAGTVALGIGALLEKAFKGPSQARRTNAPPALAPPVNFPNSHYYGPPYELNNGFFTQSSFLQQPYLGNGHTRASSMSRLDELTPEKRPIHRFGTPPRSGRVEEIADDIDEPSAKGTGVSGRGSGSSLQRPQTTPEYVRHSRDRDPSSASSDNTHGRRARSPQAAACEASRLQKPRSHASRLNLKAFGPPSSLGSDTNKAGKLQVGPNAVDAAQVGLGSSPQTNEDGDGGKSVQSDTQQSSPKFIPPEPNAHHFSSKVTPPEPNVHESGSRSKPPEPNAQQSTLQSICPELYVYHSSLKSTPLKTSKSRFNADFIPAKSSMKRDETPGASGTGYSLLRQQSKILAERRIARNELSKPSSASPQAEASEMASKKARQMVKDLTIADDDPWNLGLAVNGSRDTKTYNKALIDTLDPPAVKNSDDALSGGSALENIIAASKLRQRKNKGLGWPFQLTPGTSIFAQNAAAAGVLGFSASEQAIYRRFTRLSVPMSPLLDAGTIEIGQEVNDKTRTADRWFDLLRTRVHAVLEPCRKDRDHRVKIAILDTGIDLESPLVKEHRARVKQCKSFFGTISSGDRDSCGHGSHAAGVLLKVASNADLYVARVFISGRETFGTAERITKAITWAVDECKVDIISMSFGFPRRDEGIRDALVKAWSAGILLFAAASNNGANETVSISFPARLRGLVICANSTDGHGSPSSFNPPHKEGESNLSILGEAVESAWPLQLNKGERRRSSGTSVATPILAGVAALIIEFARQPLSTIDLEKLMHHDGMLLVLKAMTVNIHGYNYVRPWSLVTNDQERTRAEISMLISNTLKQL